LIIFGVALPWGLWQSAQLILPSRMGWWEFFHISARTVLWQEIQVCTVLVALSCAFADLKAWML